MKDSGDDRGNVQNACLEEPVDVAEALAMYQRLMLERSDAGFVMRVGAVMPLAPPPMRYAESTS